MLELKNVSAGYGSKTILKNISLTFEPGTIYAVLGKNGCGKSTLLKTCADMLTPTEGSLFLQGKPLGEYSALERARKISYLSQHRNTPGITVERLLIHGRHPHMSHLKQMRKEDRDKLEEVMTLMEITDFRHKVLSSLSGGERQRVYIAMLLAQDTPVILLDEPTTYMDIAYQLQFLQLLRQLKEAGKTIILVLHDLNHALQVADHIVLLQDGEVFMQGPKETLLSVKALDQVFHISIIALDDKEHPIYCISEK